MSSCLCESKWWAGQMSHLALPKVNKQPFSQETPTSPKSSASHYGGHLLDVCFLDCLLEPGGKVHDFTQSNNGKMWDSTAAAWPLTKVNMEFNEFNLNDLAWCCRSNSQLPGSDQEVGPLWKKSQYPFFFFFFLTFSIAKYILDTV